jgi:transposase
MFPRIVKSNKKYASYEYLVISESVWTGNGKSTTKNIANLGNVKKFSKENIKGLIDGLIRLFEIKDYALSDQVEILESLEHGSIILWRSLWKRMNLSRQIKSLLLKKESRIKIAVEKYVEIMVVNRCVNPLSKLGATRWFDTTCYKMMKGYSDLDLDVEYFYRSMDYLLKIKNELELEIFHRLQNLFSINVKLTFYDITSTFFYTKACPIGANGYSRDTRPDKEQVVIGVVTTYEGYPIKHYVFEGNTKDEATVGKVIHDLKRDFSIEETTFVGDRGMITRLNLKRLEDEGLDYIMGVKHHQDEMVQMFFDKDGLNESDYHDYRDLKIQEKEVTVKDFLLWKTEKILMENKVKYTSKALALLKEKIFALNDKTEVKYAGFKEALEKLDDNQDNKTRKKIFRLVKKYQSRYKETIRTVICLNEERKTISKMRRDAKLAEHSKELEKLFSTEKKKLTREYVDKKTGKIFEGHKKRFKKFFIWEKDPESGITTAFRMNRDKIENEENYDGIFVLTTNRDQDDLPSEKVVESYKNLKEVEQLFDDLKHFVDVHPLRHWLEIRVRAHVLLCILALLLKRIFEIDCLDSKATMKPLEIISESKLIKYRLKFSEKGNQYQVLPKVTNTTEEQKKIFGMVGIKNPMELGDYAW